jgi:MFS family permease
MFMFTAFQFALFGSILNFGAILGSITSGKIADVIGRKAVNLVWLNPWNYHLSVLCPMDGDGVANAIDSGCRPLGCRPFSASLAGCLSTLLRFVL